MKLMAGLVAAAALSLAPIAHAQLSCAHIDELNALAFDDFGDIVADEIENGYFDTDYWLDDAEQCVVAIDFFAEWSCLYVFASEPAAASFYAGLTGHFGSCLSAWKQEDTGEAAPEGEYTPLKRRAAYGPDHLSDLEWYLAFERHDGADGVDWHVMLGLSYF